MAEPTDKEQPRGPVNLRIKFRSANLDDFIERYAVDVSRGGIFIRTREPLAVGTRLKLDFQLLEYGPLLQGDGTVVWIRENDPSRPTVTPGMGVRFDQLTPESQPTLEKILSEKERLSQSGKIPGMSKSTGGMAVRRPTGSFSTVDAMAARPGMPPLPADLKIPGAQPPEGAAPSSLFPNAQFNSSAQPIAGAPVGAEPAAPAPVATSGPVSTRFGRGRTTTGVSTLRSAPNPQLFEPPTNEDIDNALAVLAEAPGPAPFVPPPPPAPPERPSRFAMAAQGTPSPVRDDGSNEPTRVGGLHEEFGANDAVTGKATVLPETGFPEGTPIEALVSDDLTARAGAGGVPAAAQGEVKSSVPQVPSASLDLPLGSHLDERPAGEARPAAPEAVQFRADATYRRPRSKGLTWVLLVLVLGGAGAGAAYKLKLFDRLRAPAAPTPTPTATEATPPPPAAPAPEATGTEAAQAAADKPAQGVPPEAPAPQANPEAKPEPKAEAPKESPRAQAQKQAQGKDEKSEAAEDRSKRKRRRAEAEAARAGQAKPAEGAPPAEGAAPSEGGAAAAAPAAEGTKPAAEAAQEKPTFKVASTPAGAEVIVDGNSLGTTPLTVRDLDPSAPHGITVKKDGYEPQDRMFGSSDWTKGKTGPSLKMNFKLRKIAAAAPAAPPSEGKASDVEVLTPDD